MKHFKSIIIAQTSIGFILELRLNVLGLKLVYKLESNITYTESLNTHDKNDQNYEGATRPMGVLFKKTKTYKN